MRLIVGAVNVIDVIESDAAAGEVLQSSGGRLVVKTGNGAVLLQRIQPAGKRAMNIDEFLRGYHVAVGERFGPQGVEE